MLQTCYANAIFYLFPECFNLLAQCGYRPQGLAAIPFIANGTLKRIDLTANMYMPEHKSETLYMLKKQLYVPVMKEGSLITITLTFQMLAAQTRFMTNNSNAKRSIVLPWNTIKKQLIL